MKNIKPKLIKLFKQGYCTPQIARVAKKIKEPSTTIHYNIKKLEEEGAIKLYKAVFDYKKINQGFCCYTLVNLSPKEYKSPERIARQFAQLDEVESIDILTGDWGMILKVRTEDQENYFEFLKNSIFRDGVAEVKTMISLKQIKTEFVKL